MAATSTSQSAAELAREYFSTIGVDRDAQRKWYADDAEVEILGALEGAGKAEIVAFFDMLNDAIPDLRFEVIDVLGEGEKVAVHWRMTGTFAGPGRFNGIDPNGARLDGLTGVDVLTFRDGQIVRNDAYTDNVTIGRKLGLMPPAGSPVEERMNKAFNARTKVARKLVAPHGVEEVADGVWKLQGEPGKCNVYFVRDGDGVLMFDAGARTMVNAVAAAAASLGGLTRIVLGHGHTDHRGTAPSFDVPVLCHPDEVVDAEGTGGWRYWDSELRHLRFPLRQAHKLLHAKAWDGGPVKIGDTVAEGDDVAGFRVVHLPGHAPGMIALWRESDRVALTTDAFYTVDLWGRASEPQLPPAGYNLDHDQARASLRKLAALDPAVAHPGHATPISGDVRAQLERAADAA